MIEVLGVKNANKLIPVEDDAVPVDPVQENQNILVGKPVKAFIEQNHQAHIQVHMMAMQDPKIVALLQNNPMAQQLQAAMMSHINEHLGFQYRVEIENQLGFNLPPMMDESGEDVHIDPETEARLAPMLSMAAQRLLMQSQQQAQAAQAQQQAQDPIIQMQQQELQLKAQEVQLKAQQVQMQNQLDQQKIELEKLKIVSQEKIEGARITAKSLADEKKMDLDTRLKGVEITLDAAKTQLDHEHAMEIEIGRAHV